MEFGENGFVENLGLFPRLDTRRVRFEAGEFSAESPLRSKQ